MNKNSKITTNGKRGGNLVGKPHKDKSGKSVGGVKAIVTDAGGRPVELEGGEVIINKEASKKHWKELSRINQSAGNGVAIDKPIDPHDEDPEEFAKGGKIQFNPNKLPNKWILKYAQNIKKNHPEIWKKGGNIYGNQAFKNLERVSERGYWLDSEEWFYIKWQSFVARHKKDFRIAGVVAMLKWVDKVEKGWQYMKNLIEDEIKKIESKKSMGGWTVSKAERMSKGGEVKEKIENILQYIETNGNQTIQLDKYSSVKKNHYGGYTLQTSPKAEDEGNLSLGMRVKEYTDSQYDTFKNMVARKLKGATGRINQKFEEGGEVVIDESIASNPLSDPKVGMAIITKADENEPFPMVYYVLSIKKNNSGNIESLRVGFKDESYTFGISLDDFRRQYITATKKQVNFDNKSGATLIPDILKKGGNVDSYKDKYNRKYGYKKGTSHDLKEIAKDSGVSLKGIQKIYNKGIGAYKTNPQSVRPNVKSKEQWAYARVYSSVMGGKAAQVDYQELKMEMGGQTVRVYSESELEQRSNKKKESLKNIANRITSLRTKVNNDLKSDDEKTFLTALVVYTMLETSERVGNGESESNGHYGITGLKKKHISINGDSITFNYTGKSGVDHDKTINNKKLTTYLSKAINNSKSDKIFETSDGFTIKNDKVNRLLSSLDITAKDIRGYSANKWIVSKLKRINPEETDIKRKKQFNDIVKLVAEKVGHGAATLKKHYLLPELQHQWIENGKIIDIANFQTMKLEYGGSLKKQEKQQKVGKVMKEFKDEKLKTSYGKKVTDKKQAIAIALSEADRMELGGTVQEPMDISEVNLRARYEGNWKFRDFPQFITNADGQIFEKSKAKKSIGLQKGQYILAYYNKVNTGTDFFRVEGFGVAEERSLNEKSLENRIEFLVDSQKELFKKYNVKSLDELESKFVLNTGKSPILLLRWYEDGDPNKEMLSDTYYIDDNRWCRGSGSEPLSFIEYLPLQGDVKITNGNSEVNNESESMNLEKTNEEIALEFKKGDEISFNYDSSFSTGNNVELEFVSKRRLKSGVVKYTFKNKNYPKGVKFYGYDRGNGLSFAKGDMAISNVSMSSNTSSGSVTYSEVNNESESMNLEKTNEEIALELKKGDEITINSISTGANFELEFVSKRRLKSGVVKYTFKNKNPKGVKFLYAYDRGNGLSFAKGDMAISNVSMSSNTSSGSVTESESKSPISYKVGDTGQYESKKPKSIEITKITEKNVYFEDGSGKEKRSEKHNFERLFTPDEFFAPPSSEKSEFVEKANEQIEKWEESGYKEESNEVDYYQILLESDMAEGLFEEEPITPFLNIMTEFFNLADKERLLSVEQLNNISTTITKYR